MTLLATSAQSHIAPGPEAGQRWRRLGDRVEEIDEGVAEEAPPRCVAKAG